MARIIIFLCRCGKVDLEGFPKRSQPSKQPSVEHEGRERIILCCRPLHDLLDSSDLGILPKSVLPREGFSVSRAYHQLLDIPTVCSTASSGSSHQVMNSHLPTLNLLFLLKTNWVKSLSRQLSLSGPGPLLLFVLILTPLGQVSLRCRDCLSAQILPEEGDQLPRWRRLCQHHCRSCAVDVTVKT